jgi:hypothetical protein
MAATVDSEINLPVPRYTKNRVPGIADSIDNLASHKVLQGQTGHGVVRFGMKARQYNFSDQERLFG